MHQSEVPFFRWSRFWEAVVSWPPWRPFRDPPSSEASSLWKMTVTGDYASTSAELLCKNDGSFNFLGREMHWKKPYWANGHIILEAFRVYVWFFILDEEKRATFFFLFFSSVYLQRFWAGIAVGLEMIWTVYLAWQISIVWLEYESVSADASIKIFSILAKKEWK